jgi:hypothetical protein
MPDVDAAHVAYDPKLVAIAPDNFLFTVEGQPSRITFLRDGNGKPEYLRHRAFVAKRGVTAVARTVDARVLRQRLRENAARDRLLTGN